MAKFQMVVQRNHYATINVEADNESQAYDVAMDKLTSGETFEWEQDDGHPFGYKFIFVRNGNEDEDE
jgi:hypothetical protein